MLESTPQFHQFIFFQFKCKFKIWQVIRCIPRIYLTIELLNCWILINFSEVIVSGLPVLFRSADSMKLFLLEEATTIPGVLAGFFCFFSSIVGLCPLCPDAWQYVLCHGKQLAEKTTNSQPNVSHCAQSILRFLLLRCENDFHLFLCEIKI